MQEKELIKQYCIQMFVKGLISEYDSITALEDEAKILLAGVNNDPVQFLKMIKGIPQQTANKSESTKKVKVSKYKDSTFSPVHNPFIGVALFGFPSSIK